MYSALNQHCTAIAPVFGQLLYRDCKNHAIPSLHRDSFVAYRDKLVAVLASGNAYKPYRRAVMFKLVAT
jgi:hypothetical protein